MSESIGERVLICSAIQCPYWCGSTKSSYGCQRYNFANACHLRVSHPGLDGRNEYALYGEVLEGLQAENKAFFLEDLMYQRDRQFAAENPDWVEGQFVPGVIE